MRWIIAIALAVLMSGCADVSTPTPIDSDGDGIPDDEEIARGTDPFKADVPATETVSRVVVSVLDTAINPYHVHFQRNHSIPDAILETFVDAEGRTPVTVHLAQTGTYDERREADAAFWDNIEEGVMYHFAGTRIIAVGHGGNIIDGGSHGTATSGAVLVANPDAIIMFSQGFGGASEQWASSQPWIDFMSESYGPIGSPPTWLVTESSTAKANKAKWDGGGIPIGAADNTPALAPIDSTAGPPWVVGVAGDHDDQCREESSGNVPDFTADFTQNLPLDRTIDEYRNTSGTSFSTPMTAGVFSAVLLEVRQAWGWEGGIGDVRDDTNKSHRVLAAQYDVGPSPKLFTNADLRSALNRTAVYYSTTECTGGLPVAPAAPWVSQGWGHIGPEIIPTTVEHILGVKLAAEKPDEARQYMEGVHRARQEAWAHRA